jgi:hypothetical protein
MENTITQIVNGKSNITVYIEKLFSNQFRVSGFDSNGDHVRERVTSSLRTAQIWAKEWAN